MKVLTIKEPWASLIVNNYKKYEFRSWKTNYRGKILIHTSSTIEKSALSRFEHLNLNYQKGAIIGEAEITACILVDEKFNDFLLKTNNFIYGNNSKIGLYAWKLENVKIYTKPVLTKGKLGLWNYKE